MDDFQPIDYMFRERDRKAAEACKPLATAKKSKTHHRPRIKRAVACACLLLGLSAGINKQVVANNDIQATIEANIDKKDIKDFNSYYKPVAKEISNTYRSREAKIINKELAKELSSMYNKCEKELTKEGSEIFLNNYCDSIVLTFKNASSLEKGDGSVSLIAVEGNVISQPELPVGTPLSRYEDRIREAVKAHLDSINTKFSK